MFGRESECVGEKMCGIVRVWEREYECVGERVSVWERECECVGERVLERVCVGE